MNDEYAHTQVFYLRNEYNCPIVDMDQDQYLSNYGLLSDVDIECVVRHFAQVHSAKRDRPHTFTFLGAWPVHEQTFEVITNELFVKWKKHDGRDYTQASSKRQQLRDLYAPVAPQQHTIEQKHAHSSNSNNDDDSDSDASTDGDDDTKGQSPTSTNASAHHLYAFVLNTSVEGSHWVAVVVDRTPSLVVVEYFDSFGEPPAGQVMEALQQFMGKLKLLTYDEVPIEAVFIDTKIQSGSKECGAFVIWYLLQRMRGTRVEQIAGAKIDDSHMNKLRKKLTDMCLLGTRDAAPTQQ